MSDDGTGQTNLTMNPSHRDFTPIFSPDGTKIAFAHAPAPRGTNADIYVMNVDGTGVTQLTTAPEGESVNSWQPLTPDQAIGGLIDDVQELVDAGSLNKGQGRALTVKLDQALSLLAKGKLQEAINVLQDFRDQVSDLIIDGELTPAEGDPLIEAANSLINHLTA